MSTFSVFFTLKPLTEWEKTHKIKIRRERKGKQPMKSVNFFFDMDGVLATYQTDVVEHMHEKGYFAHLPVNEKAVDFLKSLMAYPQVQVYILSKTPNVFAPSSKKDKLFWLKNVLPELGESHIFIQDGRKNQTKAEFIKERLGAQSYEQDFNVLIDDYSKNLIEWEKEGKNFMALKALNEVNNKKGLHKAYRIQEVDLR